MTSDDLYARLESEVIAGQLGPAWLQIAREAVAATVSTGILNRKDEIDGLVQDLFVEKLLIGTRAEDLLALARDSDHIRNLLRRDVRQLLWHQRPKTVAERVTDRAIQYLHDGLGSSETTWGPAAGTWDGVTDLTPDRTLIRQAVGVALKWPYLPDDSADRSTEGFSPKVLKQGMVELQELLGPVILDSMISEIFEQVLTHRYTARSINLDDHVEIAATGLTPEEEVLISRVVGLMQEDLSDEQGRLLLGAGEGLTLEQLGQWLGISRQTAAKRLNEARARALTHLDDLEIGLKGAVNREYLERIKAECL